MSNYRTQNTLLAAMGKFGPTPDMVENLLSYCRKSKVDPEGIIEMLSKRDFDLWDASDEVREAIQDYRKPQQSRQARQWFNHTDNEFILMNSSISLMGEHFIQGYNKDKYRLYQIIDGANKIVREITLDSTGDVRPVTRTIGETLRREDCVPTPTKVKRIVDYYMDNGPKLDVPTLCAMPDQDEWCLHKVLITPDAAYTEYLTHASEDEVESSIRELMPTFATFLGRMNDKAAFAAWMYGVYSNRFRGRQMLWLQGKGKDGKSLVFDAFTETVFGVVGDTVSWNVIKNQPEYVTALAEDKKFVYVADCSNPKILLSEVFKSLSGSDRVTINRKFQQQYNTRLEAKLAVISNYSPFIKGETHSMSRILPIRMQPRPEGEPDNENFREGIVAELPLFLAYGERCYRDRCVNDFEINVNAEVQEWIDSRVDAANEEFDIIIDKHLFVDRGQDGKIVPQSMVEMKRLDFYEMLKDEGIRDTNKISEFKEYLSELGVREHTRRKVYVGIRRRMPSDDDLRDRLKIVRSEKK